MKKRGEREIEMIHFENKELSGDEEDGESNDARNSTKRRRHGTILKLTHRREVQRDHQPSSLPSITIHRIDITLVHDGPRRLRCPSVAVPDGRGARRLRCPSVAVPGGRGAPSVAVPVDDDAK